MIAYILPLLLCVLCTTHAQTIHQEALFAPDNHPEKRLLELINKAAIRIYAAVYKIDECAFAQALIAAKQRGVDVQVLTDAITMHSADGQATYLDKNLIPVFLFNPKTPTDNGKELDDHMHHKFAIIDDTLWMGSFNWTKRAQINQESVIITNIPDIRISFEQQFELVKSRCSRWNAC